jgi:hypothetical protein
MVPEENEIIISLAYLVPTSLKFFQKARIPLKDERSQTPEADTIPEHRWGTSYRKKSLSFRPCNGTFPFEYRYEPNGSGNKSNQNNYRSVLKRISVYP